ncbi:hypothetical protein NQ318_019105 [Aromia moschata]|uniref:Peptidase aspartic putative domain-containing protein n=1 Tax=Aromia moschata TaxID=1265417 RepID=A0AAV8XQ41_9CUCU|nr:hypothetical protein NQ318_019105 [Aromia moschata]
MYYEIISDGVIKLDKNLPILQNTYLGWIVAGEIPEDVVSHTSTFIPMQSDKKFIITLYYLRTMNSQKKIFKNTTRILENGRYQVNLPLKTEKENLKLEWKMNENSLAQQRRARSCPFCSACVPAFLTVITPGNGSTKIAILYLSGDDKNVSVSVFLVLFSEEK